MKFMPNWIKFLEFTRDWQNLKKFNKKICFLKKIILKKVVCHGINVFKKMIKKIIKKIFIEKI